jgi:hypothetical protein
LFPFPAQHVKNISSQNKKSAAAQGTLAAVIDALRFLDVNGVANHYLKLAQDQLCDQVIQTSTSQKQVVSAQQLASKFTVDLEKPDLSPSPTGFFKNPNWLDPEKFLKILKSWDTNCGVKFKSMWIKISRYGDGKHLTEDEHRFILGHVIQGNALDDFHTMKKANKPLHYIVNQLALQHDALDTLDERKFQLDNFKCLKSEPLSEAMNRASTIINKLAPLYSYSVWPERSNELTKGILRQIVGDNTRAYLEMEDGRNIRSGLKTDIQASISIADEYKKVHRVIPTKEIETTFQVASMTPRIGAADITSKMDQLNHLKRDQVAHKATEERLNKMEEFMTIAAANFKKRARSTKSLSKGQTTFNICSNRSRQSSATSIPDEDVAMVEAPAPAGKHYRADKSAPSSNESGRSRERFSSQSLQSQRPPSQQRAQTPGPTTTANQFYSQNYPGSQGNNQGSQGNRKPFENRSQSKDRLPWSGPGYFKPKIETRSDGTYFFYCAPCNMNHPYEIICTVYVDFRKALYLQDQAGN